MFILKYLVFTNLSFNLNEILSVLFIYCSQTSSAFLALDEQNITTDRVVGILFCVAQMHK